GIGLADLGLANFSVAEQSTLNEVASVLGATIAPPIGTLGYEVTYDNDGSNPPAITGTTEGGGVRFRADTNADDIVGFDPANDALDFGGTSVHGMIITKTPAGEIAIDSPWSAAMQIVQGVTYQDVTIESFGVVGNEHLRQDIGGVVSWELGVGPREADTVYVRSHEYGVHDVVEGFDPSTMKLSFLYFGTRERLNVEDTAEGLVISSLPTGQSLTLVGVQLADLAPGRVEFHFDQVMEDNLEVAFGFAQDHVTLVDRTVLLTPTAPEGQSTDGFQTREGVMTPPADNGGDGDDGGTGDDGSGDDSGNGDGDGMVDTGPLDRVLITWNWAAQETVEGFDPASDVIDFGTLSANQLSISEVDDDLIIEVLDNGGHNYRFVDLQAEDLSRANIDAAEYSTVLDAEGGVIDQLELLGF
ncbi:MAG: 1,4-beta-glucanase, partial [Pseudomonadota bacterium]